MQTYRIEFLEHENFEIATIYKRSIKECNDEVFDEYVDHPDGLLNIFRINKNYDVVEVVF